MKRHGSTGAVEEQSRRLPLLQKDDRLSQGSSLDCAWPLLAPGCEVDGVNGLPDLSDDSHVLAYSLHGASQNDADLYVMINAYWHDLVFRVQDQTVKRWRRVIDTSLPSPADFCEAGEEPKLDGPNYTVRARSVVVLVRS
jgi:pullulanase/glycogen debranching enzyme